MNDLFIRTKMLIGEENFNKLKNKRVAIFGVGGVGGYVFEMLVIIILMLRFQTE